MHFDRIHLHNWRNFKAAEATLGQRSFLIGPNASGKSNLLDAFRFLRDVAESGLRDAVALRGGISSIRCLAAKGPRATSVALEVHLRDGDTDRWRYRLELTQDASKVPRLKEEQVEDLKNPGTLLVDRPDAEDQKDEERLTQTALEQIVANREFREIADFFKTISYQHLVPQVVRDPKGFSASPVQNDPFGRDLLLRLWNTNAQTRKARLDRIEKVLRQAVPQLQGLEVEMDQQGTPHLVGRYEHWRIHGARQTEVDFSDGTLRLFALLWSMFEGAGPLLLEEPELSLHPEIVRKLPRLLVQVDHEIRRMKKQAGYESRQILVSTHSEEMLRDASIGAEEVLLIVPGPEGSMIEPPSRDDLAMLQNGLTVADVLLPKSAPRLGAPLALL